MKAIVIQSFGTSRENAYEKSIGRIKDYFKEKYPDYLVVESFSSEMVRRILKKRDIEYRNMPETLKFLDEKGFNDIKVLSLYVIPGVEYEKTIKQAKVYDLNNKLNIEFTSPLLTDDKDFDDVAEIFINEYKDQVAVLMGHGSYHEADQAYEKLQNIFDKNGANIFLGTAEGEIEIHHIKERLKEIEEEKVVLSPFLLVAGLHAEEDIADEDNEESWLNELRSIGKNVEIDMRGLCERDSINELFIRKLEEIL